MRISHSLAVAALLLTLSQPVIGAPFFTEASLGAGFCGPRGRITCEEAGTGLNVDLRVGKHFESPVLLALSSTLLSLPAQSVDSGALWIHGVEIGARLIPLDATSFEAAVRLGFQHVAGVYGRGYGFGTLDLRLGARHTLGQRWTLGLDYALTRPARSEICSGSVCADTDLALLHRLGVLVGVRFW